MEGIYVVVVKDIMIDDVRNGSQYQCVSFT